MKDIFISYVSTDRPWAEWIAWVLEENGYTVIVQGWESLAKNKNAVEEMQTAIAHGQCILFVVSANYLKLVVEQESWIGALRLISAVQNQSIIHLLVEDINPTGILASLVYVDLANKSETEAEQAILAALEERSELDSPLSPETTQAQAGQTQSEPQIDIGDNDQPKQQRRSHTVQFFLEQLIDDIGIEMMLIPAGTFVMGSPEDEIDRLSSESPQHAVSVPTFFTGKYPITQAQWRLVAELPQVNRELNPDPSRFKGDKRPVENVSWYEAVEFCDRLSAYTEREYRLPTEAEWEYACRASPGFRAGLSKVGTPVGGANTPFHFGETITTDLANYDGTDAPDDKWSGSYGRGPKGEYRQETTPVDHFGIANAFGLCDMHGNVYEWCLDHWHDNYEGAPIDGSAWLSEDEDAFRVRRGGCWEYYPEYCRSASRSYDSPDNRSDLIGFRVVCVVP